MTELDLLDFYSPSAGFEQPLALVKASHERMMRRVELLVLLREHLCAHGADTHATVTAGAIRQYFEQAWPRHLQDEELDIFPRVRARLQNRHTVSARNIVETIELVTEQHHAFQPLLQSVALSLRAVESGSAQRLDEMAVLCLVHRFRTHLALEEDVLDPACARLLTPEDLRQIGSAMAARRGVKWPPDEPASCARG